MINQKYIDLMNQECDGTNSPDQSRELEEFLTDHEEARTYYRELAMALNVFEKVAMLEPPPVLGEEIVTRLEGLAERHREVENAPSGPGPAAAFWDLLRLRLRPAYAFTFAVGLMFGLALYAGSTWLDARHGTEMNGQVSGTANHRPWDLDRVIEKNLAQPGMQGLYRTQLDGPDLRLHLEIESEQPTVIRFSHDPNTGLQHFNTDNPARSDLMVSASQVEMNHRGRGSYDLIFHQDPSSGEPIKMSIFSEGRLVHSESLSGEK